MAITEVKKSESSNRDQIMSLLASLAAGAGGLGAIRVFRNAPLKQVRFLDELLRLVKKNDEPLYEALHYDYPKGATISPLQKTSKNLGVSSYNILNPLSDSVDIGLHPEILQDDQFESALKTLYHEMTHPEVSRLPISARKLFESRRAELPLNDQHYLQAYKPGRDQLEEIAVRLAENDFAKRLGLSRESRIKDFD